ERAAHRIKLLYDEVEDYYGHFRVTTDLIELRNLLQCADLIVNSALRRHECRGLHFTLDYPQTDPVAKDTVLVPCAGRPSPSSKSSPVHGGGGPPAGWWRG